MSAGTGIRQKRWSSAIRDRKGVVLVCALLAGGTMATAASLRPEQYASSAVIAIQGPKVALGGASATQVPPVESALARIRNEMLSRTRLERVMADLDLYADERANVITEALVERMRSNITIGVDGAGAAAHVLVRFVGADPRQTQRVAERLAALLIDESTRDRRLLIESTDQFLETTKNDLRKRILESEAGLNEMRARGGAAGVSQAEIIAHDVLLDTYRQVLAEKEATRMTANLERREVGEQFQLIDAPRLPERPEGPSAAVVGAAGTVAGLGLGLVLAVVVGPRRRGDAGLDV